MTIGELLELQTEIWYDYILITSNVKCDPIYEFKANDHIQVAVLNKPVSSINVIRVNNDILNLHDTLCLVIYILRG